MNINKWFKNKKVKEPEFIDEVRIKLKELGGEKMGVSYCSRDPRNNWQINRDYYEGWYLPNVGMIMIEVDIIGSCDIYEMKEHTHFGINTYLQNLTDSKNGI